MTTEYLNIETASYSTVELVLTTDNPDLLWEGYEFHNDYDGVYITYSVNGEVMSYRHRFNGDEQQTINIDW